MNIRCIIAKALKILLNPAALNNCNVDKTAKVCSRSELTRCRIGRYSYIGQQCFMVNVKIRSFCSIADRCSIGGATHPIEYISSSPVFHEGRNILNKNFSTHSIEHTLETSIENDVWLGQGVFIKAGIHIDNGAVIGMNSVVLNDVGPYEIWAGNPARFIRKRFDDKIIDKLMEIKWWEWSDDKILRYAQFFNDPERLLKVLEVDFEK